MEFIHLPFPELSQRFKKEIQEECFKLLIQTVWDVNDVATLDHHLDKFIRLFVDEDSEGVRIQDNVCQPLFTANELFKYLSFHIYKRGDSLFQTPFIEREFLDLRALLLLIPINVVDYDVVR